MLRVVGEDGARELAHLLAADEVGRRRREDPADELGVHWHRAILPSGGRPATEPLRASPRPRIAGSAICTAMTTRKTANSTLADERVDERRDPRAERRRRARGDADERRGDEIDVARRTLPIVPETAVGIIMSSDVPLAIRSLVPKSEHERRHDDDAAADAEEAGERAGDDAEHDEPDR